MAEPVIFWKESARVWPGHPGVARTYLVMSVPKKGYFSKINEAIAYAAPYERIEIGQGSYFENVVLNKPLEIVTEGGGDRAELVSHGVTLTIDCDECYVDGLRIKTSDPDQYAITYLSGKGFIQNCSFQSISVVGQAAPSITKNSISGSRTHGVYLSSKAEGTYKDNTITDHAWYCVWVESWGCPEFDANFIQYGKHGLIMINSTTTDHGERVKPSFYHNTLMDLVKDTGTLRKGLRGTERSNTKVREVGDTTSFAFGCGEERSTVNPQQEALDLRNLEAFKDRCAIEVQNRCCPIFEGNNLCNCVSNGFRMTHCGGDLLNNRIGRNAGIGVIVAKRASPNILRNTISENLHGGIEIMTHAGSLVEENMIQSNGPFGVRCSSKNPKMRFIRNVVQNHSKVGLRFKDGGVGFCEGNDIRHNALAGIISETLGNPTMTSNLLHFCGCGLVVTNFGKGTYEDNEICDNESEGVKVAQNSNPKLVRNTISLCPVGILVTQRGRGEYIENNVRDCGKTQVRVSNMSNPRFIDNNIVLGKDEGVVLDSKARGYFEGNTITNHINPNVVVLDNADPYFYKNHVALSMSEGVVIDTNGKGTFVLNFVEKNHCGGIRVNFGAQPTLRQNVIRRCGAFGIHLRPEASGTFEKNIVHGNSLGLVIEGAAKGRQEDGTPPPDPLPVDVFPPPVLSGGVNQRLRKHSRTLDLDISTPPPSGHTPPPLGIRSPTSGHRHRRRLGDACPSAARSAPAVTPPDISPPTLHLIAGAPPSRTAQSLDGQPRVPQQPKQPATRGLLFEAMQNLGVKALDGDSFETPSVFGGDARAATARQPGKTRGRSAPRTAGGRVAEHTTKMLGSTPMNEIIPVAPATLPGSSKRYRLDPAKGTKDTARKSPARLQGGALSQAAERTQSWRRNPQEKADGSPPAAAVKDPQQPPPQLTRNVIHSSLTCGVVVYGAAYPALTKNIVRDNKGPGLEIKGLTLPSGNGYASPSPTFLANEISNNEGGGVVIRLGGCGVFAQNLIHTNQPFGVEIASAAAQPFLAANVIEGSQKGLVLKEGCGGAAHGNIFRGLTESGVEVGGSCVTALSHNVLTLCPAGLCFKGSSSCAVSDNIFIENARTGVLVEEGASLKVPISGNLFVNNPVGLTADGNGLFTENMFIANKVNVLCGASGRPVIKGNVIHRAAEIGVLVSSRHDGRATIADNLIDYNNKGVVIGGQSSPQVTGNTVKGGDVGLETKDEANGMVLCNTFCDNDVNVLLRGGDEVHVRSNMLRGGRLGVASRPGSKGVFEENVVRNNQVGVVVNGGSAVLAKNYIFEQAGPGVLVAYGRVAQGVFDKLRSPRLSNGRRSITGSGTLGSGVFEDALGAVDDSNSDDDLDDSRQSPAKRPTKAGWSAFAESGRRESVLSGSMSGSFRGRRVNSVEMRPDLCDGSLLGRPDSKDGPRARRPNFKGLDQERRGSGAERRASGNPARRSSQASSMPPISGGRKSSAQSPGRRNSRQSAFQPGVPLARLSMAAKQAQERRDSRAGLISDTVSVDDRRNSRRRSSLAFPSVMQELPRDMQDWDGDGRDDRSGSGASSRRRSTASLAQFSPTSVDVLYPSPPQGDVEDEEADDGDAMVTLHHNKIFDNVIGVKALRGPLVMFEGNTIKTNHTFGVKVRQGRGIFEGNTITHQKTHAVYCSGARSAPVFKQNHIKSNSGFGVLAVNDAKGQFINNRIAANQQGVCVAKNADPLFERNLIYGHPSCGVLVKDGGKGTFRENDLSAPSDYDAQPAPTVGKSIAVETLHMYLVVGEGSHPTITNSDIFAAKIQGVYIRNGAGGLIEKNRIFQNGSSGIEVSEGASPVISKNEIFENGTQGIHVNLNSGGVIKENIIRQNQTGGIHMRGGSDCEVVDNVLENEENGGLWVTSSVGLVDGNRVIGCGTFGICFVGPATKSECTRNHVTENVGPGIKVTEGARPLLTENIIHNNEGVGVEISGDGIPRLMQNLFYQSRNVGLRLAKSCGGSVHRNLFASNTAQTVVEVVHCSDANIDENFFFGNTNTCVTFGDEAHGKITGNMCCLSGTGFCFTNNSSPTVTGNVMWKMEDYGVNICDYAAPQISDDDYAGCRNININVASSGNPKVAYCYIRGARNAGVYVQPAGVLTLHSSTLTHNVTAVEVKSGLLKCNACQVRDNVKTGFCFSGDAEGVQPPAPGSPQEEALDAGAKDVMNEKALASHPTPIGAVAMCDISFNGTGIWIKSGGNPKIRSSRLHRNTKSAVLTTVDGRGLFRDNEIYKNEDGIIDSGAAVFLENNVYDSQKHGVYVQGGASVYHSNMIYDNQYCSFYVEAGSPWLAKNKIYYPREGGAFRSSNPGTQTVKNNTVFNQQSPVVNNATSLDRRSLQDKETRELEKQRLHQLKRGARKAEAVASVLTDIEHIYKGWIAPDGVARDCFEVLGVAGGTSGLEHIRETIDKVGSRAHAQQDTSGPRTTKGKSQMLSAVKTSTRLSGMGKVVGITDLSADFASDTSGKGTSPTAPQAAAGDTPVRRRVASMAPPKVGRQPSRARISATPQTERKKSAVQPRRSKRDTLA